MTVMTPMTVSNRRPGLVTARGAVGAVGWLVLFQRRGAEGIAAVHAGVSSRCARGDDAAAGAAAYRVRFPAGLQAWAPFVAIALLNNVLPFSLIVVGQTYIPSGLASILNATTPLFTVVVMAAAGDEKLNGGASAEWS